MYELHQNILRMHVHILVHVFQVYLLPSTCNILLWVQFAGVYIEHTWSQRQGVHYLEYVRTHVPVSAELTVPVLAVEDVVLHLCVGVIVKVKPSTFEYIRCAD